MPITVQPDYLKSCFRGERLYGDDFTPEQIAQWFADEAEGYAELGAKEKSTYRYGCHQLNMRHGFPVLPRGRRFEHALGFGSAYGHEYEPIADRVERLTIVDPSEAFANTTEVFGIPARYVKPDPSGRLPFPNATFDLITCLGVLHHIPNVSFVLRELGRVLRAGGYLLIREPIVSMGDWTRSRKPHLTAHERGIPVPILRQGIHDAGLRTIHEVPCVSAAVAAAWSRLFKRGAWLSPTATRLDAFLCRFLGCRPYHATSPRQKMRASCMYVVATK